MDLLNPIYIESYKIMYIGPRNKMTLFLQEFKIGVYELLLSTFFLIFITFHVTITLILRDQRQKYRAQDRVFEIASGGLGQANFKIPKWMSVTIIVVLFLFFVFINYVKQSGDIISFLLATPRKRFNSLQSIQNSNITIYSGRHHLTLDPNSQMSIR